MYSIRNNSAQSSPFLLNRNRRKDDESKTKKYKQNHEEKIEIIFLLISQRGHHS